jgi:hypothetical protein
MWVTIPVLEGYPDGKLEWTPKESLKQQRRGSQEKQTKTHEHHGFSMAMFDDSGG